MVLIRGFWEKANSKLTPQNRQKIPFYGLNPPKKELRKNTVIMSIIIEIFYKKSAKTKLTKNWRQVRNHTHIFEVLRTIRNLTMKEVICIKQWMVFITYYLLFNICYLLFVICHLSFVIYNLLFIIYYCVCVW